MIKTYELAASGRRSLIEVVGYDPSDYSTIKMAVIYGISQLDNLQGKVIYQDQNKAKKITDCLPLIGALSIICVNERGRDFFGKIDHSAKFITLPMLDILCDMYIYIPSQIYDPFETNDGIELLFDGTKRLRRPIFAKAPSDIQIYRLDESFEGTPSCYCTESVLRLAKKSKITGLCFWDFDTRQEIVV